MGVIGDAARFVQSCTLSGFEFEQSANIAQRPEGFEGVGVYGKRSYRLFDGDALNGHNPIKRNLAQFLPLTVLHSPRLPVVFVRRHWIGTNP